MNRCSDGRMVVKSDTTLIPLQVKSRLVLLILILIEHRQSNIILYAMSDSLKY